MEMIVGLLFGFMLGVLLTLVIFNIIEERDLRKVDEELETIKMEHNTMVNKMFDDIDSKVQDDLDRRFKRGKYSEDEDIGFKYAVNPIPFMRSTGEPYGPKEYEELFTAYSVEGVPIEEDKIYPPLKNIGR